MSDKRFVAEGEESSLPRLLFKPIKIFIGKVRRVVVTAHFNVAITGKVCAAKSMLWNRIIADIIS